MEIPVNPFPERVPVPGAGREQLPGDHPLDPGIRDENRRLAVLDPVEDPELPGGVLILFHEGMVQLRGPPDKSGDASRLPTGRIPPGFSGVRPRTTKPHSRLESPMRLSIHPAHVALLAAVSLAACDDGLRPDGSLNQCHLGSVTRSIQLDEVREGTLTNFDCRIGEARGVGWLFDLAEGARVQMDLTSADFDARLILTTRSLEIVGLDDDGGEDLNARMWRQLEAGNYVLWVTTASSGELGDYALSVQEVEGASCAETVGELTLPDDVAGELTSTSCLVPDGSFADPWLLTLPEPATVEIDLTSPHFAPFIIVSDMEDEWIAWDEDGAPDGSSELTVELEAGSYKVWANTYFPGEMGAYDLSIRDPSAGLTPER